MVQQLHFYIMQEFGSIPNTIKQKFVDGRCWIYKSYSSWLETLPWLTDYAFRKVRSLLVELGIIEVKQLGLRQQGRDRTCWYTVNYEHPFLQQLLRADVEQESSTDVSVSNSTNAAVPSSTSPSVECQRTPITTSKTTSNTFSQAANQKEKKVETPTQATAGSSVSSAAKTDCDPNPRFLMGTNLPCLKPSQSLSSRGKSPRINLTRTSYNGGRYITKTRADIGLTLH